MGKMKSTAKTVGLVMIIMVFSRLLSLISNMVYITYFGINLETDIYSYATQLPNIIFNSLGTALVTIVIPIFAGFLGTGEKDRAYRFANNILSISTVFTIAISLLGVLVAPYILKLTRFKDNGYEFAVMSLRIIFPVIIFYGLNYIFQGVLQSMGRYNMPAFVSVPSSLIVIAYVYLFGSKYGVKGLLVATFIGLSTQALILIPPIMKTDYRFKPSFEYKNEDVKKALALIPPVLLGTSAYQINMLFNATLSANFEDTVALIVTVQNLVLYAVLAFIYSITSVIFPKLTMLAAKGDMDDFKSTLSNVLRSAIYFLIPAAMGMIAVRYQLIDFLYGWGKVTTDNVSVGAKMLALYAVGAAGIGIKEIIDRAFYSLKDTKRPAINGVIIMIINIISSLFLVKIIGVLGIPTAYSISAAAGAFILLYMLKKGIGSFGGKKLLTTTFKITVSSVIMLLAIIPLNMVLTGFDSGQAVLDKGIKLFIPVIVGVAVYIVATYLLRVEETFDVILKIKMKFDKKFNLKHK